MRPSCGGKWPNGPPSGGQSSREWEEKGRKEARVIGPLAIEQREREREAGPKRPRARCWRWSAGGAKHRKAPERRVYKINLWPTVTLIIVGGRLMMAISGPLRCSFDAASGLILGRVNWAFFLSFSLAALDSAGNSAGERLAARETLSARLETAA